MDLLGGPPRLPLPNLLLLQGSPAHSSAKIFSPVAQKPRQILDASLSLAPTLNLSSSPTAGTFRCVSGFFLSPYCHFCNHLSTRILQCPPILSLPTPLLPPLQSILFKIAKSKFSKTNQSHVHNWFSSGYNSCCNPNVTLFFFTLEKYIFGMVVLPLFLDKILTGRGFSSLSQVIRILHQFRSHTKKSQFCNENESNPR